MKNRFTKAEIIAAIQQAAVEVGGNGKTRLLVREYRAWAQGKVNVPQVSDVYSHGHIRTWPTALALAGLETSHNGPDMVPASKIESSVKAAVKQHGSTKPLLEREYRGMVGKVSGVTVGVPVVERYYGSWENAGEIEGFSPGRFCVRNWSEEKVGEAVREVCGDVPLSQRNYDRERQYRAPSSQRLAERFGGWYNVLVLAGFTLADIEAERKRSRSSATQKVS